MSFSSYANFRAAALISLVDFFPILLINIMIIDKIRTTSDDKVTMIFRCNSQFLNKYSITNCKY